MVFYGIKHSYFWEIEHLQDEIEVMREVVKAQKLLEGGQFELPPINVKTAGEIVAQGIIGSQFATSCIASYFNRQYIDPSLQKIQPAIKFYREIPGFLTTVKFELIEGYSLKQRLVFTGLLATIACLRSLGKRPGNLFRATGRVILAYGLGSWFFVPEVGRYYAKALSG